MRNYGRFYRLNGTTYKIIDTLTYEYADDGLYAKALAVNVGGGQRQLYMLLWRLDWEACLLTECETVLIVKEPRLWFKAPDAAVEM